MNRYGVIKAVPRDRREAMRQEDLRHEIFTLFQRKRYFTLEEVAQILNQPREPVKRVLEEVCDFNRNTREFELKKSYIN